MRDDLHGSPQVVTAAFLSYNRIIDLAGGEVVTTTQLCVCKPLVVAQIKVGLGAVVRHKDLSVLKWVHGARVHVNIRVELLKGNGESSTLQECPNGSRSKPFAQGRKDPAGHEDELGWARHKNKNPLFNCSLLKVPRVPKVR